MTQEKTPSGAPLYRYDDVQPVNNHFQPESHIEEITEHIEKYIGEIDTVFHEIISDIVHIDVLFIKPTKEDPTYKLITSGMSDLPMTIPSGIDVYKYAEVMITLPSYWKLDNDSIKDEKWYWPIRLLKELARFPHLYSTFLGIYHTYGPNEENICYHDSVKFCGSLLSPTTIYDEDFITLKINEEKEIIFLSVIPLYKEEVDLKINEGTEELFNIMPKLPEVVDIKRKNKVKSNQFYKAIRLFNKK